MTPPDAAKLLDLPVDATVEQLEARFLDLRTRLEDKVAKAPTPGLKAKYRETLEQVTAAFESLTLAADGSALPLVQKPSVVSAQPSAGGPASPQTAVPDSGLRSQVSGLPTKPKASSKEFLIVALIAVALLGAGGWYVMKTRAEKTEQARLAAEAAAQALQVKQAEDARVAMEVKTAAQLRTQLATARVAWEALENRLRDAERRTSEAKNELRSFRDGPAWKKAELSAMAQRHEMFSNWLNEHLAEHPFKVARATAEQLLNEKLTEEAAAAVAKMQADFSALPSEIRGRAELMLAGAAEVTLLSKPAGMKFIFTDAYGRSTEGVTPATLAGQPFSHLHHPKWDGATGEGDTEVLVGEFTVTPSARFHRAGWKDVVVTKRTSSLEANFSATFDEGTLEITSKPTGLKFTVTQLQDLGWTATGTAPSVLTGVPVGKVRVTVERPGYGESSQNLEIAANQVSRTLELGTESQEVNFLVAEAQAKIFVDQKFVGRGQAKVLDLAPGEHAVQLEAEGYLPYRTKFKVAVSNDKLPVFRYSFKELALENVACSTCYGSGSVYVQITCKNCNGDGWMRCPKPGCDNGYITEFTLFIPESVRCGYCQGNGRVKCNDSKWTQAKGCGGDGLQPSSKTCQTCGGDGHVSQLQLSQSL